MNHIACIQIKFSFRWKKKVFPSDVLKWLPLYMEILNWAYNNEPKWCKAINKIVHHSELKYQSCIFFLRFIKCEGMKDINQRHPFPHIFASSSLKSTMEKWTNYTRFHHFNMTWIYRKVLSQSTKTLKRDDYS